ncbi:MAG: hypothetical protein WCZ89_00690 [Phycisphaerae bacterium]
MAYFLTLYLSPSAKIQIENGSSPQISAEQASEQVGKVGDIGIGEVEAAKFVDFHKDKSVSREFGFEKMLHRTGEQWQVENPFMNIYQKQFRGRITADKAVVLAAQTGTSPSFKEATLVGNVIVQITPEENSSIRPVTVYLDDIVFISERSLFLTAGPVRIIADDMQLIGRGLEIVYNYELDRIELFRIIHLETLCFNKSPQLYASLKEQQDSNNPTISAEDSVKNSDSVKYQAVFSGNVMIRTAQQIIFAEDRLNIINLIQRNEHLSGIYQNTPQSKPQPEIKTDEIQGFMEVILTCENGLVFSPMDSPAEKIGLLPTARRQSIIGRSKAEQLRDAWGRDSIFTNTITYDVSEKTAAASGKSEFIFNIKDSAETDDSPTPLTLKTDEQIVFDTKSNQIIFGGYFKANFFRSEQNDVRSYTFTANRLIIDLEDDNTKQTNSLAPQGLKHIFADGNITAQIWSEHLSRPLAIFSSPQIDFYARKNIVQTTGLSRLEFYTDNNTAASENITTTITAQQGVQFDLESNTVVFEGGTQCRTASDLTYILTSETLTAQLNNEKDAVSGGIKTLSAAGNPIISVLEPDSSIKKAQFAAEHITYEAPSQKITANGISVLNIFPDENEPDSSSSAAITAKEKTTFCLISNQVVFLGDCEGSTIRTDSQIPRKYILKAPKITVDIADSQETESQFASSIKKLTADDDASIIVTPVDSNIELAKFNAPQITYTAAEQIIKADGPCSFNFYANDFMPSETLGSAIPVSVTAKESTIFSPADNTITFNGDCICSMVRITGDIQNKYTLSAPRINIKLSQDHKGPKSSVLGLENVKADGGIVQLSNIKTSQDKLQEFSRIKCQSFEFDTKTKTFSAIGPGLITVDNSKIHQPENADSFSLNKRCYAFVRDFENLQYLLDANQIIASNQKGKILIDYFPIDNDQTDTQIKASASEIKINLLPSGNAATEIASIKAFGGITYEDNKNHFSAGQMIYDAAEAIISASANDAGRCYLNGVVVDKIVYNIEKNTLEEVQMTEPGIVQMDKRY